VQSETHDIQVLDLRHLPPGRPAHTEAFYALKELPQGAQLMLITAEDPQLLVAQLQLQLRNRLAATVEQAGAEWHVHLRRREETAAVNLMDLLSRDHERLDRLFSDAIVQVGAGRVETAVPVLREFLVGLRRHIHVENEFLAPRFPLPRDPHGSDPTSTMLREHDDILRQAQIIEDLLNAPEVDIGEADTWFGLLAATLSKHEGREETRLFPIWDALLRREGETAAVLARAQQILAGDTDTSSTESTPRP
jgi:uncharacterized protein (DUF2249 family)